MLPFILLPNFCKYIGVLLYVSGFILAHLAQPNFDDFSDGMSLTVQIMLLIGLLLIACSKQRIEDEWMQHYRLVALQWSLVIYIAIRLFGKLMAYFLHDGNWQPEDFQINFLLLVYICLFHYFAVVKDRLYGLFKGTGGQDEK
jgi:hypothetical protein